MSFIKRINKDRMLFIVSAGDNEIECCFFRKMHIILLCTDNNSNVNICPNFLQVYSYILSSNKKYYSINKKVAQVFFRNIN